MMIAVLPILISRQHLCVAKQVALLGVVLAIAALFTGLGALERCAALVCVVNACFHATNKLAC